MGVRFELSRLSLIAMKFGALGGPAARRGV